MLKRLSFCLTVFLAFVFAVNVCAQRRYDMSEFRLLGTAVKDAPGTYSRMPDSVLQVVRSGLADLGKNTAGMSIRFASDASTITAYWTVNPKNTMNHMAVTGIRGLDLYMLDGDIWRYVGTAIPKADADGKAVIIKDLPRTKREYLLHLPLYDGLESLALEVNKGATITMPDNALPLSGSPVVMYGTSIMQGGCASRPGMTSSNILQRRLNREVINLGFSGNAHLDPEIADLMADIDASVYVIDVLPNNTVKSLNKKLAPFYRILRERRPDTPIVLVEHPSGPRTKIDPGHRQSIRALNATLRAFYETCLAEGDENVYYVEGTQIMDEDAEGTVDGTHYTDLGFTVYANALYPLLSSLLNR